MFTAFLDQNPMQGLLTRLPRCPFPAMEDRAAWEALPEADKADLLALAEGCGAPYPLLRATDFLAFIRSGSRTVYEQPYFYRRRKLIASALHCCLTGRTERLDDVIDGLWCICEESSWVISAHNINPVPGGLSPGEKPLPDPEDPYIDLFAAQTGMILACVCALLAKPLDRETPMLRRRVEREIRRRITEPFLSREDYWWMGVLRKDLCNWTPWILSNILCIAELQAGNLPELAVVCDRACRILDRWLAVLPADGGCDEGTAYYNMAGGALLDCLELLERITDGRMVFWQEEKIRNILAFPLATRLEGGWFVNFADCDARPQLCGERLQLAGKKLGMPALTALGLAHRGTPSEQLADVPHFSRLLNRLFHPAAQLPAAPFPRRDVWLGDLQLRVFEQDGMILCAKGGHNGESHNHNDVGSFILQVDGQPAVVDAGNMVYTAKTFSHERYTLMNTRAAYHNLPLIGGEEQQPGSRFAARDVQRLADGLSLELSRTYSEAAGLCSFRRSMRLQGGGMELRDSISLAAAKPVTWVFMLREKPVIREGRAVSGCIELALPAGLTARTEEIPVTDSRMAKNFPGSLWRLLVTAAPAEVHEGCFRIRRATGTL
ncbi:MAG: heparinase II/III family protein [Clostridia bacterium]|nr:heparinase II/III family protein [Clostridia bacterium]